MGAVDMILTMIYFGVAPEVLAFSRSRFPLITKTLQIVGHKGNQCRFLNSRPLVCLDARHGKGRKLFSAAPEFDLNHKKLRTVFPNHGSVLLQVIDFGPCFL